MLLYNVTIKIDSGLAEDWLQWMNTRHIPDVLKTGHFLECRLSRLKEVDESEGITYSIQYLARSKEAFDQYQEQDAPELQQEHAERYKDNFVAFRTIMDVLERHYPQEK